MHWFDTFPTHRLVTSPAALGSEVLLAWGHFTGFSKLRLHLLAMDVMWPLHGVQQQVH